MNQVDDHWMRPRTKAGTEEMRKRLKVMRELLQAAARHSIESEVAHKVFDEYFSFDWEDRLFPEEKKVDLEKKKVALPDRC
tara:strand:- start:407 stop:649 length:243 start_codon:yes stop_codon:yes gene_type:complete